MKAILLVVALASCAMAMPWPQDEPRPVVPLVITDYSSVAESPAAAPVAVVEDTPRQEVASEPDVEVVKAIEVVLPTADITQEAAAAVPEETPTVVVPISDDKPVAEEKPVEVAADIPVAAENVEKAPVVEETPEVVNDAPEVVEDKPEAPAPIAEDKPEVPAPVVEVVEDKPVVAETEVAADQPAVPEVVEDKPAVVPEVAADLPIEETKPEEKPITFEEKPEVPAPIVQDTPAVAEEKPVEIPVAIETPVVQDEKPVIAEAAPVAPEVPSENIVAEVPAEEAKVADAPASVEIEQVKLVEVPVEAVPEIQAADVVVEDIVVEKKSEEVAPVETEEKIETTPEVASTPVEEAVPTQEVVADKAEEKPEEVKVEKEEPATVADATEIPAAETPTTEAAAEVAPEIKSEAPEEPKIAEAEEEKQIPVVVKSPEARRRRRGLEGKSDDVKKPTGTIKKEETPVKGEKKPKAVLVEEAEKDAAEKPSIEVVDAPTDIAQPFQAAVENVEKELSANIADEVVEAEQEHKDHVEEMISSPAAPASTVDAAKTSETTVPEVLPLDNKTEA